MLCHQYSIHAKPYTGLAVIVSCIDWRVHAVFVLLNDGETKFCLTVWLVSMVVVVILQFLLCNCIPSQMFTQMRHFFIQIEWWLSILSNPHGNSWHIEKLSNGIYDGDKGRVASPKLLIFRKVPKKCVSLLGLLKRALWAWNWKTFAKWFSTNDGGGGSKADWNFSKNSSVLETPIVPNTDQERHCTTFANPCNVYLYQTIKQTAKFGPFWPVLWHAFVYCTFPLMTRMITAFSQMVTKWLWQ